MAIEAVPTTEHGIDSHMPTGLWSCTAAGDQPTLKVYGGTKPAEKQHLWFTRRADTVGPDNDTEKTSASPQLGTVAVKGNVARVNVEYYLRIPVRRHCTNYLKAALMLADIYHQPGENDSGLFELA